MNSTATPARYADLSGRGVFVSGGATGIGMDIVRAFDAQGARTVFVDIDQKAGVALAEELDHAVFRRCDVTDDAVLIDALRAAEADVGLEVLVNNAANDTRMDIFDVDADDWTRIVNVNLRHQFFAAQTAAGFMKKRGRGSIINFGSVAPEIMVPNLTVYEICKSGARGLTRSLARDLGHFGVRVNSILPGCIMTARQKELWFQDPKDIEAVLAQQCLKRELIGADVAQMALFLASDASSACTAQDFIVDGGLI